MSSAPIAIEQHRTQSCSSRSLVLCSCSACTVQSVSSQSISRSTAPRSHVTAVIKPFHRWLLHQILQTLLSICLREVIRPGFIGLIVVSYLKCSRIMTPQLGLKLEHATYAQYVEYGNHYLWKLPEDGKFLPARRSKRGICYGDVAGWVAGCLIVTRRYCIKTAKPILKRFRPSAGRSGLAVACLTAVREVPGSNRAVASCVYRTTTVIYSLWHGLCAPFLQCLGQLSLLPSMGR